MASIFGPTTQQTDRVAITQNGYRRSYIIINFDNRV